MMVMGATGELYLSASWERGELLMSSEPVWTCQQSVDVHVPLAFAWGYMTDIRNWNDPPAEFVLDGPFVAGARGTTSMPGRPPVFWTIDTVDPGHAYTIRSSVSDGVSMLFHWRFEASSSDVTTLSQRLELGGEDADGHVSDIRSAFESNLEPGMHRIARMMEAAAASMRRR